MGPSHSDRNHSAETDPTHHPTHTQPTQPIPPVANIALVKPDKARSVENMILSAAQRGAITEKVTEERLRGMLEQLSETASKQSKVTIQRRRPMFDEDD